MRIHAYMLCVAVYMRTYTSLLRRAGDSGQGRARTVVRDAAMRRAPVRTAPQRLCAFMRLQACDIASGSGSAA